MSDTWPMSREYEFPVCPAGPTVTAELAATKNQLATAVERVRDLEAALAVLRAESTAMELAQDRLAERMRSVDQARQKAMRRARVAEQESGRLGRSVSAHKARATRLLGLLEELREQVRARERELLDIKADGAAQLVLQPLIRKWLLSPQPKARFRLPRRLILVGHGPLSQAEMSRTLAAVGVEAVAPSDPLLDVMVVGRDGWLVDDLEDQIRARGERISRVYSQEMLLAACLTRCDPLDASKALLKQFAEGHDALQYLISSGFNWPLVNNRGLNDDGQIPPGGESPLHTLGYIVGRIKGLPEKDRQTLLKSAFSGELPSIHSKAYMQGWGTPRSRARLRRMARHLHQEVMKRVAEPMYETAVTHWTNDLVWMRETLYEPWMRFRWPKIGVKK